MSLLLTCKTPLKQFHPLIQSPLAASLNKRFDMNYTANHIFPTSGAAGALAHALRAVTSPGDDVLTFAPYFPEYNCYVGMTGANLRVVPANTAPDGLFGVLIKTADTFDVSIFSNCSKST